MNFPINISTDLTPEAAYCIGAIVSSARIYAYKGKNFYLVTVRHNSNQATDDELKRHVSFLKRIAKKTKGKVFLKEELVKRKWFEKNKDGFAIVFSSTNNLTITEIVDAAHTLFQEADNSLKRAFLIGAFDGRGSWDRNLKKIVLDCSTEVKPLLNEMLLQFGIHTDYNPHRDRREGGRPRANQLRISASDMSIFFEQIGLISPAKIRVAKETAIATPLARDCSTFLPGLTTLVDFKATKSIRSIPKTEKKDVELDREHEEKCLREIGDVSFSKKMTKKPEYGGKPKEKEEQQESGGRRYYPRNHTTALNALIMAEFKCEYNNSHETFIRKKDGYPYTEPHHLVPLSYSGEFPVSLDVEENIVSLCSTCHNRLHYGKDIAPLLEKLFLEREDHLRKAGIAITFEQLLKMYKQ